jgi:hypothetical protein
MLGPDGGLCRAATKGLLTPRPVRVAVVHLVGKEGNRLEEVATGEVTNPDEVLTDYGDDRWEAVVRPILSSVTVAEIGRKVGMDRAGLSDYLKASSSRRPPDRTRARLTIAASKLLAQGFVRRCAAPGCEAWARPLPSITCSERHRKAVARVESVL